VHLATEEDLRRDYPEFELGAVPPVGGRRDPVVVDLSVANRESVVIEAGSHDQSLRLAAADLVHLAGAAVTDISANARQDGAVARAPRRPVVGGWTFSRSAAVRADECSRSGRCPLTMTRSSVRCAAVDGVGGPDRVRSAGPRYAARRWRTAPFRLPAVSRTPIARRQ
jgi:Aminoacyl-tRNA editing domain